MYARLLTLESSVGVGDRDNRGTQSEQRGQKMGNQSCPRTQEHHTLQESKMDIHPHTHRSYFRTHTQTISDRVMFLGVLFSVSGGVWQSWFATHRAVQIRPGDEDRRHQRKPAQGWGLLTFFSLITPLFTIRWNTRMRSSCACSTLSVWTFDVLPGKAPSFRTLLRTQWYGDKISSKNWNMMGSSSSITKSRIHIFMWVVSVEYYE